MRIILRAYENKILTFMLIALLSVLTLALSVRLLTLDSEIIVVRETATKTEIITKDSEENRVDTNLVNFFNYLYSHYYSFSSLNYAKRVGKAFDIFEDNYLENKVSLYYSELEKHKNRNYLQWATIVDFKKISKFTYKVKAAFEVTERIQKKENNKKDYYLSSDSFTHENIITIVPVKRSLINPYGYEVMNEVIKKY